MVAQLSEPKIITEADLNPRHNWQRAIYAPGVMNVDFEERIDFRRLHRYRLARTRQALKNSDLGAVLTFDANNIRYMTSTAIGEWSRDKMCRFALLAGDASPHLWDFGSAAAHHRLYAPWLEPKHCHAGMLGLRGAVPPESGLMKSAAKEIKAILEANGVADQPLGVDLVEPPMLWELQKLGIEVRDGQQVMLDAREIKNMDEIMLLNVAASMVDAVYQMIYEELKPGVRARDDVALADARLQLLVDHVVDRVDHRGRDVEQHDLVHALDFARIEHDLLRIPHVETDTLQLEQHRRLDEIDAERLVGDTGSLEDGLDFLGRVAHQAGFGRHGAAQAEHAGVAVALLEPRRVNAMVRGGGAEIPQVRRLIAGKQCEATHFVARPLTDISAGDITDIVRVERQDRAEIGVLERLPRAGQAIAVQPAKIDTFFEIDGHRAGRIDRARPIMARIDIRVGNDLRL